MRKCVGFHDAGEKPGIQAALRTSKDLQVSMDTSQLFRFQEVNIKIYWLLEIYDSLLVLVGRIARSTVLLTLPLQNGVMSRPGNDKDVERCAILHQIKSNQVKSCLYQTNHDHN